MVMFLRPAGVRDLRPVRPQDVPVASPVRMTVNVGAVPVQNLS
jgi:hypothetical protein